jgi:hypothetical protein
VCGCIGSSLFGRNNGSRETSVRRHYGMADGCSIYLCAPLLTSILVPFPFTPSLTPPFLPHFLIFFFYTTATSALWSVEPTTLAVTCPAAPALWHLWTSAAPCAAPFPPAPRGHTLQPQRSATPRHPQGGLKGSTRSVCPALSTGARTCQHHHRPPRRPRRRHQGSLRPLFLLRRDRQGLHLRHRGRSATLKTALTSLEAT